MSGNQCGLIVNISSTDAKNAVCLTTEQCRERPKTVHAAYLDPKGLSTEFHMKLFGGLP